MDAWLEGCGLEEFMAGWTPRAVREGRWSAEVCRWCFIEQAGERVGTVWVERESESERVAHLGILIATEAHRGKGLGSRVIRLVEREAVEQWGVTTMTLRVRASNAAAVACYHKAGYEVTERSVRNDERGSYEVLHMAHVLGREA